MDGQASRQDVQERLQALGLDRQAAASYARLLRMGPTKATEFAEAEGISRDESYRRLHRLIEAGLATSTLTRPLRFVPLPPRKVFQRLHQQSLRMAAAAQQAEGELVPALEQLVASAGATDHRMPFQILNGRERVYDALHDLIDEASREILIANTHARAASLVAEAGILERMRQKAEVGLVVRLLLRDDPTARRRAVTCAEHVDVRLLAPGAEVAFCITDASRLLHFAHVDPSPWMAGPNDAALLSSALPFVETQRMLFRLLWKEARPLDV